MKTTTEITSNEDVIDSRDVIARIEYLEGILEDEGAEMDGDERTELDALKALQEEAEGYSEDWQHGSCLIRDSYMQEYAQQTAEDCGMIPANLTWPFNCIDWEQATRDFKMDYTQVDFDGVEYWIR